MVSGPAGVGFKCGEQPYTYGGPEPSGSGGSEAVAGAGASYAPKRTVSVTQIVVVSGVGDDEGTDLYLCFSFCHRWEQWEAYLRSQDGEDYRNFERRLNAHQPML